jgi:hypothetical protein
MNFFFSWMKSKVRCRMSQYSLSFGVERILQLAWSFCTTLIAGRHHGNTCLSSCSFVFHTAAWTEHFASRTSSTMTNRTLYTRKPVSHEPSHWLATVFMTWVRISVCKDPSLRYRCIQYGSGVHTASYVMGTGVKAAGSWSWPLTFIYCQGFECAELFFQSPWRPSWRCA